KSECNLASWANVIWTLKPVPPTLSLRKPWESSLGLQLDLRSHSFSARPCRTSPTKYVGLSFCTSYWCCFHSRLFGLLAAWPPQDDLDMVARYCLGSLHLDDLLERRLGFVVRFGLTSHFLKEKKFSVIVLQDLSYRSVPSQQESR